jgi:hypothetical protein
MARLCDACVVGTRKKQSADDRERMFEALKSLSEMMLNSCGARLFNYGTQSNTGYCAQGVRDELSGQTVQHYKTVDMALVTPRVSAINVLAK